MLGSLGDAGILGEEEVMDVGIADADTVGHFVPVVVGIEGVAGLGGLAVVQLAVAARQVEAADVVGQMALANAVDRLVIRYQNSRGSYFENSRKAEYPSFRTDRSTA